MFAIQLDRYRGQYTPRPSAHPPIIPCLVRFPGFHALVAAHVSSICEVIPLSPPPLHPPPHLFLLLLAEGAIFQGALFSRESYFRVENSIKNEILPFDGLLSYNFLLVLASCWQVLAGFEREARES